MSGLPAGSWCRFENFNPSWHPETNIVLEQAIAECRAYVDDVLDGNKEQPMMLTLAGAVGTGKSHLLQSIAWELMEHGMQPRYVFTPDWLAWLRKTFSPDAPVDFEHLYESYAQLPVLLLDDLGAERASEWTIEVLGRIVDRRYREKRPLVVATNKGPWDKATLDQFGFRLIDRLFDTGSGRVRVVSTGTRSYRTGH